VKIVGLNIEPGRVSATVVQRQFGRTEVLDAFVRAAGSDAEAVAVLREKAPAWAGANIVSAVPGRLFTQRVVTFPFSDRKKIEKALPFELEDLVPFPLDSVVLGHLAIAADPAEKSAETKVFCLMLPKEEMRRHLELLAGAGIDPHAVVPSFAGLAAVARLMPAEGMRLLVAGSDLCLTGGRKVLALRGIAGAATGGLRHAVQAFETEQKERVEKAVLLRADDGMRSALADLGLAAEEVLPEIGGKRADDPVSLGIALTEGLTMRTGDFAYRRADEGMRRKQRTLIIAAAVVAVLAAVNIAVKFSITRSGYGRLDREIKEIYHQTFPDARPPGDPVREMRDRLNEAKRRFGALGSGTSALDVMQTVTDAIPKEIRVTFQDFQLEGDRLRLQGDAPSFESVDRVKAEMQKSPLFTDVAVQDTRMGVDNKVKFRFEIKLKQTM
jgi:general secretion pathway protein L